MKIKSIRICGMRKLQDSTYDFEDVNYLIGDNGAGKSTVLNAINLAILGYIPGTPKTLKKIMENSNGPVMSTQAILDDAGAEIIISRTWIRKGQSIESNLDIRPADYSMDMLVADIELPVYNFGELISKSANEQKDYFINHILISENDEAVDVAELIRAEIAETKLDTKYTCDVETRCLESITQSQKDEKTSIETVQNLNKQLKEMQSLWKSMIDEADKTLATLVKSDDDGDLRPVSSIDEDIKSKHDEISKCKVHAAETAALKRWEESAGDLVSEVDTFDVNFDIKSTNEYKNLMKAREAYDAELKAIQLKGSDVTLKLTTLNTELAGIESDIENLNSTIKSGGVCQYTHKVCSEISKMIEALQQQVESKQKSAEAKRTEIFELEKDKEANSKAEADLATTLVEPQMAYDDLSKKYLKLQTLKNSKPDVKPYKGKELTLLEEELNILNAERNKAAKKETYDKLHDDLIAKKSKYEIELNIIKALIKYTGPNKLQNSIMTAPFKNFEMKMSETIKRLFDDQQLEAAFNLSNTANSFSFGIARGEGYIPYQTLSSGEKCLYMIAFILTIMKGKDNNILNTIILDDVLDHLDSKNAALVFDSISEIHGEIQFIMAGVKECNTPGINKIELS